MLDATIVSEEVGELGSGRWRVVIDPIDGSLNAKRGIPFFSLSIAVADGETMARRAVRATSTTSAAGRSGPRGAGRARSSTASRSARSVRRTRIELLAFEATLTSEVAEKAAAFDGVAHRLRIMGSLALSLCHLAAGRLDAVCSLKPYRSVDVAAGQLLVLERGLPIANVDGDARFARCAARPRRRVHASRRREPTSCAGCRDHASIRIGCSGWNYAHWRNGVFYPPRLPASKWLEHYAQFFDTVEVNATFYRLPKRASVARWVEQIAARIRLRDQVVALPDAHQAAERPRAGLERFYACIEPLLARSKLGPILWQLPPNFKRDDARLVDALERLPREQRHAFEFRERAGSTPTSTRCCASIASRS